MKLLTSHLMFLLVSLAVHAEKGPLPAANSVAHSTKVANLGAVRFQFSNILSSQDHKDSVLIIFDRYDHTGAGVIYQVFAADQDNSITIPEIPSGKYFVTIQCLGVHRDRMEKLISIKKKKNEMVRIALGASEVFSKDKVVIPAYNPNFSDLSILKSK